MFTAYLGEREVTDPRLERAFDVLHDALSSSDDDQAVVDLDFLAAPKQPESAEVEEESAEEPRQLSIGL